MGGITLGVFAVDYRGFTSVSDEKGCYSEFTAEYFFAGTAGPKTRNIYENYTGEISLQDEVHTASMVYSECGSATIFRINTAIRASRPPGKQDVLIQVDSTDTTVTQSFRYYLAAEPC